MNRYRLLAPKEFLEPAVGQSWILNRAGRKYNTGNAFNYPNVLTITFKKDRPDEWICRNDTYTRDLSITTQQLRDLYEPL